MMNVRGGSEAEFVWIRLITFGTLILATISMTSFRRFTKDSTSKDVSVVIDAKEVEMRTERNRCNTTKQ
jgi:hypothetical protein